jgi:hypothetical protein
LVEEVCEDASDAGGTVTEAGERGTTSLAQPLTLRRAISDLIDNAINRRLFRIAPQTSTESWDRVS